MCLNMQQWDLLQFAQLTPPKALNSSGQSLVTTVCLISGVHEGQAGSPFSILAQTSAQSQVLFPFPNLRFTIFLQFGGPLNYLFSPSSALASLSQVGPTGIMTLGTITLLFLQPCSQETAQHAQLHTVLCCPTTLLSPWLRSKPGNVACHWINQSLSSQSSH